MAVGAVANGTVPHAKPDGQAPGAQVAAKIEESRVCMDKGVPRMTSEMLKECCTKNQGWSQPELNDFLMLGYKGFRKIENLQPFVNIKTLWLECNGISRIEGLDALPGLLSLYLQSNVIERIENLDGLTSLQFLDLSNNSISMVDGLANLTNLVTIKLAGNRITEVTNLRGFTERPTLRSVDMSRNYIEDGEAYLDFWTTVLPDLECVYLHHNPCSRGLKDYRRRMVSGLKRLRWIDDRKVDELERVGAEAWAAGGKDAEMEAKRNHILDEREEKARSFQNFQRVSKAAAARLVAQKEAQAAQDSARDEAAAELAETGSLSEGWVASSTRPASQAPTPVEEPQLQSQLKAKVQAFLKSRPPADAETPATASSAEPVVGEAAVEQGGELAEAQACPGQQSEGDASLEASVETAEEPASEAASEEAPVVEFEWTNFRDKRLGRLAAECRYDFKKVAARLSEEFSCAVEVDACRQQYRKLITKKDDTDSRKVYTGRAKDAPDLQPEEIKEVSKWWVHQISSGAHFRQYGPSKASPQKPTDVIDAGEKENACTSAYVPSGDGFHEAESTSAISRRPAASTAGGLGALLGDVEKYAEFAPPPRVTASPVELGFGGEVPRAAATAAKDTLSQSELFDLD